MTTDDLLPGLTATRHRAPARAPIRLLPVLFAGFAACSAYAQTTPPVAPPVVPVESTVVAIGQAVVTVPAAVVAPPASAAPAPVAIRAPEPVANASVRDRATDAAAATLTALLPRLAGNEGMPLLDRSTMLAGDLGRLLADYDLSRGALPQETGGRVQSLLKRALTLVGTPYRWGGTSPESGFDCSGLVGYVFRTALGIELPRVSRDMARKDDAQLIDSREELQQGDLVFFGRKGQVNHVGIYVGEGQFLHSPSRGKDVRVDSLVQGYWSGKFMQARRLAM